MTLIPGCSGCALIGMVHLAPLPGSHGWAGSMDEVLRQARSDAQALINGGCDALLVENMGDAPYLRSRVRPETLAAATVALSEVCSLGHPTGLQLLAAANRQALGAAVATGASFIRVEAFAYAHVADEGGIDASAGPLLRARAALGSSVGIWADVKKKHAGHAVTSDVTLQEAAEGTAFCGADVLIVTGTATGRATDPSSVQHARSAGLPVVVGSGVTPENIVGLLGADGLIVGSYFKEDGDWRRPVSEERVRRLRREMDKAGPTQ